MAEKVTVMVLKVDLQCSCSYKKIKKLLCEFPQIRDQMYDEKQNQVVITVVCCSPEKIRDMLCCKGGKLIKSIEIREPPKPPITTEPKTPPKKPPTPKKPEPVHVEVQFRCPPYPGWGCCGPCSEGHRGGPCYQGCKRLDPPQPPPPCCGPCSEGHPGGPCYQGYGRLDWPPPPPPRLSYEGCGYGGGNKGCYVSRCDYYFSEENPKGCTIM